MFKKYLLCLIIESQKGDDFMKFRIRSPNKKIEVTFGKMLLLHKICI